MDKIIKWLSPESEKCYKTGLALFVAHTKNKFLANRLSKKENPGKLEYELRKFVQLNSEVKKGKVNAVITDAAPPLDPKEARPFIDRADLPEDLQKLYDGVILRYRFIRALRAKAKCAITAEERKLILDEIESHRLDIRAGFRVIDKYINAKKPSGSILSEKEIANKRKYLSVSKNAIENLVGAKRSSKLIAMQSAIDALLASGQVFKGSNKSSLEELGLKFE